MRDNGGSPPAFKSPAVFKKKMLAFFDYCEEKDKIPFIVEFANFCGLSLNTLDGYKNYPEFKDMYALISQAAHAQLLQGGVKKQYSDKLTQFCLINHHGYNKDEVDAIQAAPQKIEIVVAQPPEKD